MGTPDQEGQVRQHTKRRQLSTFKNGVSQATADSMLKEDVKTAEDIIHDVVQVPMYQHEYDALVSLIFTGRLQKCPKLLSS
jgi:GH24 family phage-related lysozyme (muramidase)